MSFILWNNDDYFRKPANTKKIAALVKQPWDAGIEYKPASPRQLKLQPALILCPALGNMEGGEIWFFNIFLYEYWLQIIMLPLNYSETKIGYTTG